MIPGRASVARRFADNPTLDRLTAALESGATLRLAGAVTAARPLLAAVLAARLRRPVLLVVSDPDAVGAAADDVRTLHPDTKPVVFNPGLGSSLALLELPADAPALVIADHAGLEARSPVPRPEAELSLSVRVDSPQPLGRLVEWLEDAGYERVDLVTEPGEYATRGGIVDVFPEAQDAPVRVEFSGDTVVSMRTFDPLSQRSVAGVAQAQLATRRVAEPSDRTFAELVPASWLVIAETPVDGIPPRILLVDEAGDLDLGCSRVPSYLGNFTLLRSEIAASGLDYYVASSTRERAARLESLLPPEVEYVTGPASAGFAQPGAGYVFLTERELYGAPLARPTRHRFKGVPVDNLVTLRPGDYVVHLNYGIGRFEGTRRLSHAAVEKDYVVLRYQGSDRVYVPVENIGLLDRYVGAGDEPVQLDRIGGRSWLLAKARAARASAEYAAELLETEARRSVAPGTAFPPDGEWQRQLEASFPHAETPDQEQAITAVKRDMESPRPMERLVSGDVGYGKTEVALRAAFKAVAGLKQVALLVPTTILCYQHYSTFRRRLEPFPVRIEMLSRFVPARQRRLIVEDIAAGRVDVVIGTQLLLGENIRFRDLGLLVVDEEQKFGVRQKDRVRKLRASVDVLSLTATPLPRTLYLALSGLRAISNINTPPPGRREVLTEAASWSDDLVVRYVEREVGRGGQVFFVHNRIASLPALANRLRRLFPGLDIVVAHGQMPERELEEIYLGFAAGEHQMLLSTAIIESGLDLPNVNTIIVDSADRFGLADLHQLRGRVGRSGRQAHALFLIPSRDELTHEARKRLSALLAYSRLGSGFRLALRDLEIRGAGDLLGTRQHGQVARVGLNLYARMLEEAVARLRGETVRPEPELALDANAFLPREYVPDAYERVALYRRLLGVADEAELEDLRGELCDRFGRHPAVVENLFRISRVKVLARRQGLLRVELKTGRATVVGPNRTASFAADLAGLLDRLASEHF